MNADVLDLNPSLRNARRAFDDWRSNRTGRGRTPVELRQQALALLEHHCAFHVCKALGINAVALKRWAGEPASSDAKTDEVVTAESGTHFIKLPEIVEEPVVTQGPTACTIERLIIELPNQTLVRVSGSFTLQELFSAAAQLCHETRQTR